MALGDGLAVRLVFISERSTLPDLIGCGLPAAPLRRRARELCAPCIAIMATLEGPDDYISLGRAARLSGRSLHTIVDRAFTGRLRTVKVAKQRLTTRLW